jgi:predicted RNA-binding Zn-ribbon protein involved in translation (DUF1610 family)
VNKIRMKVIDKPEEGTATVFVKRGVDLTPFFKGEGPVQFVCGKCKHILASKVEFAQVTNIVFKCPKCGEYNQC